MSRKGTYLASGGEIIFCSTCVILTDILQGIEGLKIWNIKSSRELPAPQQSCEQRGQVSCSAWITRQHEQRETLCFGTGLGYLVFWREGEPGVSG